MNILRFFEISLARHVILNPFSSEKLERLGDLMQLGPDTRLLDLCCGKGEMLCTWAARHGIEGLGVDISETFLEAAHARAAELGVEGRASFEKEEAAAYARAASERGDRFARVACIGATWIGGGLTGTLELIKPLLADDEARVAIGEPYWIDEPPEEAYVPVAESKEVFTSLIGTLERIESTGFELVEMVMAAPDDWDRYEAAQWTTMADWSQANPADPEAAGFAEYNAANRDAYLRYGRRYLGWGVFVLAPRG